MATPYSQQLSPEFLAQLMAYQGTGPQIGPDGNLYYSQSQQGGSSGADGTPTGFYGISPEMAGSNSGTYSAPTYDASGKQSGSRDFKPDGTMSDLMGVLAVLGTAAGGAALGAGGAGSGAAAGAGGGELATGGFLGEAPFAATGGGALDFGAGSAAAAGGGGAALGGGGGSALGGSGGGLGSLLGGGSGLGGMGSLLGPAATLLGGMLGSKGTQQSTNTTKDIPDWLKPSVAGLLTQTDALRNKQMSPGYMQGYDDMRNVGQGLLNQPIAGNGVGKVPYPNFGFQR